MDTPKTKEDLITNIKVPDHRKTKRDIQENDLIIANKTARGLGYENGETLKKALTEKEDQKQDLATILARELGYKTKGSFKQAITQKKSPTIKGRLTQGESVGSVIAGGIQDAAKESFSYINPKKLAKNFYKEFFNGSDIFSAYMRGKLNRHDETKREKTEKDVNEKETTPEPAEKDSKGFNKEGNILLKIIAKNSLFLVHIARDVNIFKQNIGKLLNVTNSFAEENKRESIVTESRNYFLKEEEAEKKLKEGKTKATPEKNKNTLKTSDNKAENNKLGFLRPIIDGIMEAFKILFSPASLIKLLGKIFIIGDLLYAFFKGISKEIEIMNGGGTVKQAIIEGFGTILSILTLGLFGKDTAEKIYDATTGYIDKITNSFSEILIKMQDWIANNIFIPTIPSIKIPGTSIVLGPWGPWYPFKRDVHSTVPQDTVAFNAKNEQKRLDEEKAKKEDSGNPKAEEAYKKIYQQTSAYKLQTEAFNKKKAELTENQLDPTANATELKEAEEIYKKNIAPRKEKITKLLEVPGAKELVQKRGLERELPGGIDINSISTAPTIAPIKPTATPTTLPKASIGSEGEAAIVKKPIPDVKIEKTNLIPPSEVPFSGAELNKKSSEVLESQRKETDVKIDNIIDKSVTNNNKENKDQANYTNIEVYDIQFSKYFSVA